MKLSQMPQRTGVRLAFRLVKKHGVGASMRAALAEDLDEAHAMLAAEDLPLERRVHQVRRKLKRDRSLVRTFEPVVPELASQIRVDLRDAGRHLAALREAHALAAAAADLARDLDAAGGAVLTQAVAQPKPDQREAEAIAQALERIAAARALVGYLPIVRGRKLFNQALADAHRRSRGLQRKAARSGKTADLHEWRKALKDIVHLTSFGNGQVRDARKLRKRAHEAEELLGKDHDLAILRGRLVKGGKTAAARFVSNVEIGGRRAKLQKQAFALGRRIGNAKAPRLR